jgi:hypothetical protein
VLEQQKPTKALVVSVAAGFELWYKRLEELVENFAGRWPTSIFTGLQLLELVWRFALLRCRCTKVGIKRQRPPKRWTNDSRSCTQVAV